MFTLGLAALFCAACVDDSTGSGGEVNALLEKYNNPNNGGGAPNVTTYTVKFNANGGTGAVHADIPVSANNSITLPDKGTLSNGELVFSGWNTKPDGTGINHPAGTAYTVTGNITLYATWKEASTGGGEEAFFTLTTNINPEGWGKVTRSPNSTIYREGTKVTLTAIPEGDFIFKSWTYAGTLISENATTDITIDDNKTIFANFDIYHSAVTTFLDSRENKTYRKVTIVKTTWMAENLNYETGGSVCYDNAPANCTKYGRLYDWDEAMRACPAGWRLPTDGDWRILETNAGLLKATSGWNDNGNGTDDYGFAALPGGLGYSDGRFYSAGDIGYWWSATEIDANYAWYRNIRWDREYMEKFYSGGHKSFLFSVRCVQD